MVQFAYSYPNMIRVKQQQHSPDAKAKSKYFPDISDEFLSSLSGWHNVA